MNIFYDEKIYFGEEIDLIQSKIINPNKENNYIKIILFDIVFHHSDKYIGSCDLRIGNSKELYLIGNIGYSITQENRGNNYAYKACKMIFEIAKKEYNMNNLIITCSSNNIASFKTCLKLNGEFIENIKIDKNHYLYKRGEYEKNIFQYVL